MIPFSNIHSSGGHGLAERMVAWAASAKRRYLALWIVVATASGGVATAEETTEGGAVESRSRFGGPDTPEAFLDEIERRQADDDSKYLLSELDRLMGPWFTWKKRLETDHNLRLGGFYSINYQKAGSAISDPDYGFGSLARGVATWTPGGRDDLDAGSLVATLDYRTKLGDGVPPNALGNQIGYVGTTNVIIGDSDWDLVHLNWAQPYRDGTSGFAIGRIDPNEHFYTHGFSSPWTGFMNNEVVNPVSAVQPQSSWGLLVGHYFTDQIYGVAGAFDANGTAADDLDWFSGGAEFWSAVELGYVPSQKERFEKKTSLTAWHVDPRTEAQVEEGYGFVLAHSWTIGEFNPFTRVGWSDGTASPYNKSFLAGFRHKFREGADILGVAFGVGDSSTGLGTQNALEVFYNFGLAENLALTFDVQRIGNPLLNQVDEEVWLFGTRLRLTF